MLPYKSNYQKVPDIINVALLNNPDLILKQPYSSDAAIISMMNGLFSGKGLPDYFNGSNEDWVYARRVINGGLDHGQAIAELAKQVFFPMQASKGHS
jgi:hypothetical protein